MGPKFRVFSLFRCKFRSLFPLLRVLSWKCGHGTRLRSTQSARLGFSGVTGGFEGREEERRAQECCVDERMCLLYDLLGGTVD